MHFAGEQHIIFTWLRFLKVKTSFIVSGFFGFSGRVTSGSGFFGFGFGSGRVEIFNPIENSNKDIRVLEEKKTHGR